MHQLGPADEPARPACPHRHAQARPGCAPTSAPSAPRAHAYPQRPHARAARACCLWPARPARTRAVPARLLRAPRACCLSCDTGSPVSCHNTPGCIAIQPCLLQPFQPQYSLVYCDTLSQPSLPACNTIFVLQYKPCQAYTPKLQYNNCIAIQFSCNPFHFRSQYTLNPAIQFLPHNTNWAVANFQISAPFFFLFFFHYKYIYFFIISSRKKKSLKSYYYFFFHFLGHSNKFIKIYFTPFSSISHLVKS